MVWPEMEQQRIMIWQEGAAVRQFHWKGNMGISQMVT